MNFKLEIGKQPAGIEQKIYNDNIFHVISPSPVIRILNEKGEPPSRLEGLQLFCCATLVFDDTKKITGVVSRSQKNNMQNKKGEKEPIGRLVFDDFRVDASGTFRLKFSLFSIFETDALIRPIHEIESNSFQINIPTNLSERIEPTQMVSLTTN